MAVFLLAFPLNVLLKGTASIYTVYICEGDVGEAHLFLHFNLFHTLFGGSLIFHVCLALLERSSNQCLSSKRPLFAPINAAGAEVRRPWWQALGALRASAPLVGALRSRVAAVWRGVFFVELIVAAAVVPLQVR